MRTFDQKSRLVFKLYTNIDLKCSLNPQHWYLNVCLIQQILGIVLEFTYAMIYITDEGLENCTDFIYLTSGPMRNMDTKKHQK